jgi:hypothetical protein
MLASALERLRNHGEPFGSLVLDDPLREKTSVQVDGRRLAGNAATLPMMVLTMRDASSPR